MTVTNTTTTTLATGIKDVVVQQPAIIAAFQNTDFTSQLRNPYSNSLEGTSVLVNYIVTSNAEVATHAEATNAYPDSSASVYQQATFPFTTVYGAVNITDDVKRALGPGLRNAVVPGMLGDLSDTIVQVRDLFETTMLADAATGLQGMIDDDTTALGGISRGTYTLLQSYVGAGGSANLTAAMLHTALRSLRAPNYGVKKFDAIWSNAFQQQYYLEKLVADAQGVPLGAGDITYANDRVYFAGIPWIVIPDFVASELDFVSGVRDGSGIQLVDHNYWDVSDWQDDGVEFQRVQTGPDSWMNLSHVRLGRTGPFTKHVFGLCGAVIVILPQKQGKYEALATS